MGASRLDLDLSLIVILYPHEQVIRKKGTEPAGSGEYDSHYPDKGVYECAGCGTPLYTADTKVSHAGSY